MMKKINFLTAGESHGKGLIGIIDGLPSGLEISEKDINLELRRRQMGFGRGGRMKIENDKAIIYSGVRLGKTLGSPISILIENKDWENWTDIMSITSNENIAPASPSTENCLTAPAAAILLKSILKFLIIFAML